ncbi:transporter [Penicillium atrosanguineum]|uniref:transporter n=1 Tax=Penicillium atrosanguineum TaxID=1132637 RepID=UPI002393AD88|nr:transporter [Penicillium atrosanguineum]KAJ5309788.1 transporter [Penicillium atrosanguineum]
MHVSSHVSSNVSNSEVNVSHSSVTCSDSNTSTPNDYTRLLPESTPKPIGDDFPWDDEVDKDASELPRGKRILTEFWELLKGSVPVIMAYMLQMSLQTIPVIIVGHLSPMYLAVSAFSLMFALVTGWMIALGGTTAMDTLASSTFTGSENKHDLGILLQRAFLVLGAFYIPVAVIWACSNPIFQALGQDPELSYLSSKFLTALIPGGLGYIYFETMKKYLQAQGIMRAGTYVLLITSPLNAGLCYLFCYTLDFGLLGAPLAADISYWTSFILLVLYAKFVAGSECWGGWSRAALTNLWAFARLAILGILHVGTEWWAFEIVALVAGRLGTISLASQSVIMTADQIMNTIPFGLGVATSSRVGNLLGSRNSKGASRAAHSSAILAVAFGAVVLAILMGTRNHFAKIFNDDPEVVELTAEIMPFVALFQIADGMNGSCGGSLRGMGRQHIGAAINLVSYYCFALPLGVYLAFHGWGLKGLWVGQCVALYCAGILEWVLVAFTQWENEVRKAFKRMDGHGSLESGAGPEIAGNE